MLVNYALFGASFGSYIAVQYQDKSVGVDTNIILDLASRGMSLDATGFVHQGFP